MTDWHSNKCMLKAEGYFCNQKHLHESRKTQGSQPASTHCTVLQLTCKENELLSGFTWLLETFWANSACPGSVFFWTSDALVFLNNRSACKGLLLKTETSTMRCDFSINSSNKHRAVVCVCIKREEVYLCGVFGNVAVVGLQCGVVWHFDPNCVFQTK